MNLLFPPKCIFCGSLIESGATLHICGTCYKKIPFAGEELIYAPETGSNAGCDGVICVCRYSGIVKDSLIRYKFHNKPGYYRTFAKLLSNRILKVTNTKKFDIIASVPLHKHREFARGYNQAYLISRALSSETGIPECSRLLERFRKTDTQSLLDRGRRLQNVKGAFRVTLADNVKGKSILLVDDILTTGSTVDECSRVLKEAGAKSVTAAVIATGRKL